MYDSRYCMLLTAGVSCGDGCEGGGDSSSLGSPCSSSFYQQDKYGVMEHEKNLTEYVYASLCTKIMIY